MAIGEQPEVVTYRIPSGGDAPDSDPIATEVIRHGLSSAANQAKLTLMRTAVSPLIYEVLDFAVALYDRQVRMVAQAPSLPFFMGTLNFCVEAAVAGVGGEEALDPGDVVLYNVPYGSGTHQQDIAVVMPAFTGDGELVGYAAMKGHLLDLGAKEPYCTDTVDVFQEGTLFPGVKLVRRGELVDDIFRICLANTRVPKAVAGDLHAAIATVRAGTGAMVKILERHGAEQFASSVERMYDHGEAVVRSYFERLPDGRYVAEGIMDDNGVSDDEVPFEIAVEIDGSTVRVDFSGAPDQHPGPMNCPFPTTVAATRVAIATLAGASEAPNEGHFRPIEVTSRVGSMFHPVHPAPCYMPGWVALQTMDVIYHALSKAMPAAVPACSGGDVAAFVWWGVRESTGEPWADGHITPIGQGAHVGGDGPNALNHNATSSSRITPLEVWEAKNPWLFERCELAPDSGGAGRHRGGLGLDVFFHMLEDTELTSPSERTKHPGWALEGGREGRVHRRVMRHPDGTRTPFAKATRLPAPKGSTVELYTPGGGGYGPPSERDPAAVRADLREGYITPEHARTNYPHAVEQP